MSKCRLAVIFGGVSSEHEVSLVSAASVIDNIPKDRYDILMLGITKSGRWLLYTGPSSAVADGSWEKGEVSEAVISPDAAVHGLIHAVPGGVEKIRVDAAFPVLHGKNGEDGTVQGLLTLAGIPFVGCDTLSSAVCMDKAVANTLCGQAGVRQAKWEWFLFRDYQKAPDQFAEKIGRKLGWPVFVKPANSGSSVGISKAKDAAAFDAAVRFAAAHDEKIVVEEAVRGREIECAVLGNAQPLASVCGEIIPGNDFYDYSAKYIQNDTRLEIPARLPAEISERVRQTAVEAFRVLGCRGMARADFFVDEKGEVLFNELNTIPGFTQISMYPKLFAASGLPYPELLDRLVSLGMEK